MLTVRFMLRVLVLLLYILSIIPSSAFGTTLCLSGGEIAFEGLHVPSASINKACTHSADTSCNVGVSHHSHSSCYDVDDTPINSDARTYKVSSALPVINSFDKLFADAPFRAPPSVELYEKHLLPPLYGLSIISTFRFTC